jgi:hypothetical protein
MTSRRSAARSFSATMRAPPIRSAMPARRRCRPGDQRRARLRSLVSGQVDRDRLSSAARRPARSHWTAILTVVLAPPSSAETLRKNPLGLYVDAIDWSRELEPGGVEPAAGQARSPIAAPARSQHSARIAARSQVSASPAAAIGGPAHEDRSDHGGMLASSDCPRSPRRLPLETGSRWRPTPDRRRAIVATPVPIRRRPRPIA